MKHCILISSWRMKRVTENQLDKSRNGSLESLFVFGINKNVGAMIRVAQILSVGQIGLFLQITPDQCLSFGKKPISLTLVVGTRNPLGQIVTPPIPRTVCCN